MKIVKQSAELMRVTQHASELIEAAGRTCYKSEDQIGPGTADRFIRMLITRGHESVLEHASATFRIVCDRGVSHELVRHRLASYSQESTRYCCYKHEITVIEPPGLTKCDACIAHPGYIQMVIKCCPWAVFLESVKQAQIAYLRMIKSGIHAQIARAVLPTCLKTEVVMTANFREWRHFLSLRTAPAAHPQMREVAEMIAIQLNGVCPAAFPLCTDGE